ncbi:serine hydrolase domain-containing protein [Allostreptomyces psammosilenae]|uniref:D-alanyl-D-alanine carboxypeptidase n=1 Tax=Allostreptomyces psammosilenae TaxID=1892865 RepID=A0A853A1H1_9ACTN|nr:serine hydrolase domain-containing protein [Allostreptomyces psammosilenae]NYI08209.1 D-alanyl-D-alanine carboxypeptidase [Allostreptomyces psammosilenae]
MRLTRRPTRTVAATLAAGVVAGVLAAAPASAAPATSPATAPGGGNPAGTPARPYLQAALDGIPAAGVPGALALVEDEQGRWLGGSGVADVRNGRAVDPAGRYRAASVTKTFVATVVLQLVAEGRLGLDDPVADHLPGLLPYPEPITVRQLLQHTSGLPRDIVHWHDLTEVDTARWRDYRPLDLVAEATRQPLAFAPGTGWQYSNIGYTVLGLLIEEVTGHSLNQALTSRVLRPLGLRDTYLSGSFPFVLRPAFRGYELLYEPYTSFTDVTDYNVSRVWASGSLVSSARDLNRFYGALLEGELLPAEQLAEMQRTVPIAEGSPVGYGLGLFRLPVWCGDGMTAAWGHGGDLPGFSNWALWAEDTGAQIAVAMSQSLTLDPESTGLALNGVLAAGLCGEQIEAPAARAAGGATVELPDPGSLGPLPSAGDPVVAP